MLVFIRQPRRLLQRFVGWSGAAPPQRVDRAIARASSRRERRLGCNPARCDAAQVRASVLGAAAGLSAPGLLAAWTTPRRGVGRDVYEALRPDRRHHRQRCARRATTSAQGRAPDRGPGPQCRQQRGWAALGHASAGAAAAHGAGSRGASPSAPWAPVGRCQALLGQAQSSPWLVSVKAGHATLFDNLDLVLAESWPASLDVSDVADERVRPRDEVWVEHLDRSMAGSERAQTTLTVAVVGRFVPEPHTQAGVGHRGGVGTPAAHAPKTRQPGEPAAQLGLVPVRLGETDLARQRQRCGGRLGRTDSVGFCDHRRRCTRPVTRGPRARARGAGRLTVHRFDSGSPRSRRGFASESPPIRLGVAPDSPRIRLGVARGSARVRPGVSPAAFRMRLRLNPRLLTMLCLARWTTCPWPREPWPGAIPHAARARHVGAIEPRSVQSMLRRWAVCRVAIRFVDPAADHSAVLATSVLVARRSLKAAQRVV